MHDKNSDSVDGESSLKWKVTHEKETESECAFSFISFHLGAMCHARHKGLIWGLGQSVTGLKHDKIVKICP